jgi:hypothetical protein
MKYLLIILLIISLNVSGQYVPKHKNAEAWKVVALYGSSVILNAMGDAYMDMGQKKTGHALRAASIGCLLAQPLLFKVEKRNWWVYPSMYIGMRFMFFDYTYNTTRGLPLDYMGNTSYYDETMRKQQGLLLLPRGVLFSITMTATFRELKK